MTYFAENKLLAFENFGGYNVPAPIRFLKKAEYYDQ